MHGFIKRATRTRARLVATLAVLMLGVSATSALAYFGLTYAGTTGSLTATIPNSGGVQGSMNAVTFGGTITASDLVPGGTPAPITITEVNTTGSAYTVKNVVPTISVTNSGTTAGTCNPAWFAFNAGSSGMFNSTGVSAPVAPAGSPWTLSSGTTISMTSLPTTDQTGCEGQTLTLALAGP